MMRCDHGLVPDFLRLSNVVPEKAPPPAGNHGKHYDSKEETQECKAAEKEMGITRLNRGRNYAI